MSGLRTVSDRANMRTVFAPSLRSLVSPGSITTEVTAVAAAAPFSIPPPPATGSVPDDTISPRPLVTKYRTESASRVDTSTRISLPATTGLA